MKQRLEGGLQTLAKNVAEQYAQKKSGGDEDISARVNVEGPHGIWYALRFRRRFKGPWVKPVTAAFRSQGHDITPLASIEDFSKEMVVGRSHEQNGVFTSDGQILGEQEISITRNTRRVSFRKGKLTGWRKRVNR